MTVTAQDELEALFHLLPPVPLNSGTHKAQIIQAFESKCQVVEERLTVILDQGQAKREEDFNLEIE